MTSCNRSHCKMADKSNHINKYMNRQSSSDQIKQQVPTMCCLVRDIHLFKGIKLVENKGMEKIQLAKSSHKRARVTILISDKEFITNNITINNKSYFNNKR